MISIAFTGGGTGGHIYPGLAVASWIQKNFPCRIFWIGSNAGMDRAIVESSNFTFFGIPSGKLRRYFSFRNFFDVFRIVMGFFAAFRILKRERPGILFSKGGFVSIQPCTAAKFLKIPVFTHESDFSPGLATRINTMFAEKIFIPYKESAAFFPARVKEKLFVSGNPIRPEFAAADPAKGRVFLGLKDSDRVLLVLGGSLGSREINLLVKSGLTELTRHYTVVHQTGEQATGFETDHCKSERYKPYAYFRDEIPHIIVAAELVLCRSGAGTIWECKSLNKPMVMIPFRGSGTRGDQVENAKLFEKAGAAVCFTEAGEDAHSRLSALVNSLAEDPARLKAMGQAQVTESNATEFIAKEIISKVELFGNFNFRTTSA